MSDHNLNITIKNMQPESAETCEQILRALPKWFGIEEAIVDYRTDIEKMPTFLAHVDNHIVGFLTIRHHNKYSAEIQVMGVLEPYHKKGIGRALVGHIEPLLHEQGVEYLEVKTLAPSSPNEPYKKTRQFYKSCGFRPLEENELWGKRNPCLIMIKRL